MAQKQVIALIRTSTTKQEVESQKKELLEFIKADGVSAKDIIIVGHEGASAIKVDEAYQKNMNEVYSLIDGGDIAAVYAWAIDRIGRNEEILMGFKNKLIKCGVQLVIKNPSLRLLEDDGKVNTGIELAFSLFATMAKQEMESKKARFERAKRRNAGQGKYNGGKVHYGYKVDDNGKVIVDDKEAVVVRLIFDLYKSGEYSTTTLTKELQSRGYKVRGKAVTLHFVTNMLKSTAFIGYTEYVCHEKDEDGKKTDIIRYTEKRTYDRIISDETFNEVKARLTANHKGDITRQSKHTYLASKLIVCPECGRHWFASNRSYTCIGHKHHGKGLQGYETCPNGDSIAVEWLDVAAWSVAKQCEMDYIYNFTEDKAEQAQKQIEVNDQKIETLKERISGMDARRQRIAEMYINGDISRQEQERQSTKVKTDTAEYRAQIVALEEDNKKLNEIAQFDKEGTLIHLGRLPISGIYEDTENAYRITHKYIKQITVEPYEYNGKTQKMITISTVMGDVMRLLYIAKSKVKKDGHIYKLFYQSGDEFLPLYAHRDYVPPFVQE